jgi:Zn-dependent metalloprotease
MRQFSRPILASLISIAFAGAAHAGVQTVDNLHLYTNTAAKSADDVLRANADRFGLPASLNNLTLVKVQESLTGTHYHYQQMLRGIPVDRAVIIVSIGKNGQLQKIFNETRHVSAKVDADAVNQLYNKAQLSEEQALDKGWNNMKVQHPVAVPTTELVWMPTKDGVQLARKVQIQAQMPTGGFVQYLNAHDGSVMDSYSLSMPRKGERTLADRAKVNGPVLDRKSATQAVSGSPTLRTTTATATLAPRSTRIRAPR